MTEPPLISQEQTIGNAYLIIPGLFDSGITKYITEQLDFAQLTSLSLFKRGKLTHQPLCSADFPLANFLSQNKSSAFNYALVGFQQLLNEGKIQLSASFSDDYYVYQVSPVYLKADMNRLLLQADLTQQLNPQEVLQLSEQINQYFALEKKNITWQLVALDAMHWYCVSNQPLENALAIFRQVGKSVDLQFSSSNWQAIQTELQMWLFNSQLNQQRQQQGLMPVNSLWLWGGGKVSQATTTLLANPYAIDCIVSDNPFNQQFANIMDIEYQDLESCKKLNHSANNIVLLSEQLRGYGEQNDWYSYFNQLEMLHKQWFQPLQKLLKKGQCKKIILFGDEQGNGVVLQQKDLSLLGALKGLFSTLKPQLDPFQGAFFNSSDKAS